MRLLRCSQIIDLYACKSLFPSDSKYLTCFFDLLGAIQPHEESVTNPKVSLQVVMAGSKVVILYVKAWLFCSTLHTSFHVCLHLNFMLFYYQMTTNPSAFQSAFIFDTLNILVSSTGCCIPVVSHFSLLFMDTLNTTGPITETYGASLAIFCPCRKP